ncbi:MAG TPA: hypothetical protein VMG74_00355 [Gaiellaceae bacterium]|nr:hypothetical protein [Gaiellaceae bacterium]
MDADLFDEQAQQFLGLLGALVSEDVFELVGEAGKGGRLGRRVRPCAKRVGQLGFLLDQNLQPGAVAADAVLAVDR